METCVCMDCIDVIPVIRTQGNVKAKVVECNFKI